MCRKLVFLSVFCWSGTQSGREARFYSMKTFKLSLPKKIIGQGLLGEESWMLWSWEGNGYRPVTSNKVLKRYHFYKIKTPPFFVCFFIFQGALFTFWRNEIYLQSIHYMSNQQCPTISLANTTYFKCLIRQFICRFITSIKYPKLLKNIFRFLPINSRNAFKMRRIPPGSEIILLKPKHFSKIILALGMLVT